LGSFYIEIAVSYKIEDVPLAVVIYKLMIYYIINERFFWVNFIAIRFMQLDLGHLEVHNSFEWHGGDKNDASAVHLDVLHAEVCAHLVFLSLETDIFPILAEKIISYSWLNQLQLPLLNKQVMKY
jgi:hypothetical protein